MKKQLKKLLLVFGLVAVATMSYASVVIPVKIDCGGSSQPHTIFSEGETLQDALEMANDYAGWYCSIVKK